MNNWIFHSSLNDPNDGKLLLQSMREELGDLYGLALCGGRVPWKNEENLAVEDWQNAFFELVIQPYGMALYFSQICAPKSRIVALSSISSNYGGSTTSRHYGAAKAALDLAQGKDIKDVAKDAASDYVGGDEALDIY